MLPPVRRCEECGCISETARGWLAFIAEDPDDGSQEVGLTARPVHANSGPLITRPATTERLPQPWADGPSAAAFAYGTRPKVRARCRSSSTPVRARTSRQNPYGFDPLWHGRVLKPGFLYNGDHSTAVTAS